MTRRMLVCPRATGGMIVRAFVKPIVLFALFAAPLLLFSHRAHATAGDDLKAILDSEPVHARTRRAPAWLVKCPGVSLTAVYKSGWFTYSSCSTEGPASIPFGCTWIQMEGCASEKG